MPSISLNTAISITGLSRRTLWRRISEGCVSTLDTHEPGVETRVSLDDVLPLSCLPLQPDDHAVIVDADAGDAVAQCDVALMWLAAGRADDAVPWLVRSAKQHYPDAMCYLGRLCLSGEGIARDRDAGLMWLSHAAVKRHVLAPSLLAFLQSAEGQSCCQADDPSALNAALDDVERQILLNLADTADGSDRL